jgi:hypothetical protein
VRLGWIVLGAGVAATTPALYAQEEPPPAQDTAPPVVPRFWGTAAAQYARATGEFARYVRDGGGIDGSLIVGLGANSNIALRISGQVLIYGSQTRSYSLLPGIIADVTTSNLITGLMIGPQINAGTHGVRAYGFVGVGFNYFATTSEVTGSGSSEPFATSTNYDDITLALEGGGGVLLRLGGTTSLDLGARYVSNGHVNYVTREGVRVIGGNFIVSPVYSDVTLVVYHVGVSIGLTVPTPAAATP